MECADCTACIYFASGRIAGAAYQLQAREEAFFMCFYVPIKRYRFHEESTGMPPELAISMHNTALLLGAAARRDKRSLAR